MIIMKKIFAVLLFTIALSISFTAQAAGRDEDDFIGASYQARVVNCQSWVSLRYAPSTSSERLIEIPLGTIVTVYDCAVWGIDGFYPVEYDGYRGYVLKEYLEYHSGGGAPR